MYNQRKFWNNDKPHGVKTMIGLTSLALQFWNNDKPHGIKTFENILH